MYSFKPEVTSSLWKNHALNASKLSRESWMYITLFSGSFHDGMPIHTSFVSFFNTLSSYTSFKIFFPTFWTGQRASITQNWRYSWYSYSCIFTQYSRPCILYVAIFRCVLASLYVAVSVRRSVRPSVGPSVRPSVGPLVHNTFVKSEKNAHFSP